MFGDDVYEEEVPPRASSTIETMRSVGYSPETALADLIDNSITAGARSVFVNFHWAGQESVVTVRDDGRGMATDELVEAMRLGSGNPRKQRKPGDLGRFGMGLKTASFSQCRRLTVVTRRADYAATYFCWDLDTVAETDRWQLLRTSGPPGTLDDLGSTGTVVVWEKMDRLTGKAHLSSEDDRDDFWAVAKSVKSHLAMVFHRFLGDGRLKITVNGDPVVPWNPFFPGADGGQSLAEETFHTGRVSVRSYVLPHPSRFSAADRERAGGVRGWTGMQGFYVYRAERMLVAGSWLGLARQHEDTKLARIMIDISNADDEAWQIDIKKSTARPPASLKGDLNRLARHAQSKARQVYSHRGVNLAGVRAVAMTPLWDEMLRQGKRFNRLNRKHPAIELLLDGPDRARTEATLRMIEETVPVARIYSGIAAGTEEPPEPLEGEADGVILSLIRPVYAALLARRGATEAAVTIRMMDPFSRYPALVERFLSDPS